MCFLLVPITSHAYWDLDIGVPASIQPGNPAPSGYPAVSDGAGGVIVAWSNSQGGSTDVYAQRIDALGEPRWGANGVAVCTATGGQDNVCIVTDGMGGAIVAWTDQRGSPGKVYAQRIDAAGVVQWATNGIPVCTDPHGQAVPGMAPDGAGGAIVAFNDTRPAGSVDIDLYAQRINSDGVMEWAPAGVPLCIAARRQVAPRLAPDGAGGAVAAWEDYRADPDTVLVFNPEYRDVYAQRINAGGVVQWTTGGVAVCTATWEQGAPRLVTDQTGGAIVCWLDARGPQVIYAQRIGASGVAEWATNGVPMTASASAGLNQELISDGSGGAIVVWDEDDGVSPYDVYAQRVDASGSLLWGSTGLTVFNGSGGLGVPVITGDGNDGAIVAWTQTYAGLGDIYAQRLDGAGNLLWNDGVVVCGLAASEQLFPVIVSGSDGTAVLVWRDNRNVTDYDLYAGTAPLTAVVTNTNDTGFGSLRDAITTMNVFSEPYVVDFDMGAPGPHTIVLHDPLPTITVPVIIDGYSHPGSIRNSSPPGQPFNGTIQIGLEHWLSPAFVGLLLYGDDSVVRGLSIDNFSMGIYVDADRCVVEGNLIGLNPNGSFDQGNYDIGVRAYGAHNRIGGLKPAQRNIVSGNGYGICIDDVGDTHDNQVVGNWIGTDLTGLVSRGNFYFGVGVVGTNNVIGGPTPEAGNVIAYSTTGQGVLIGGGTGNRISGNSVFSNGALGIDLYTGAPGVTANDVGDVDSGANTLLNFPVIAGAVVASGSLMIDGTYSGAAGLNIELQFFANPSCDGSGYGEGKQYLGSTNINTASGTVPFSATLPVAVALGSAVTATAIDAAGNTSEFSACAVAVNTPSGSDVVVVLDNGGVHADLTFDNVTTPGNTSLSVPGSCTALPGTFLPLGSSCYDVATTAAFSGNVEVCFNYDESAVPGGEANIRLLHYDATLLPPQWVDITTSIDAGANIVCGVTDNLSPFVLGVGSVTAVGPGDGLPTRLALRQNVPNPFNPTTVIRYDVPVGGARVSVRVYDVAGRLVQTLVDGRRPAGTHDVTWDGLDTRGARVASGVYFCRMESGTFTQTRKMVLLK